MEKRNAPEGAKGLVHPNFTMQQCPRFNACNAPICPFDAEWKKRRHLNEDRVCFYLLEASKTGAKAVFEGAGLGQLYQAVSEAAPAIRTTYFHIDRACNRASASGSRMANGHKLRKGADHA